MRRVEVPRGHRSRPSISPTVYTHSRGDAAPWDEKTACGIARLPGGEQRFWGVPFRVGSAEPDAPGLLVVGDDGSTETVRVSLDGAASYLLFAHLCDARARTTVAGQSADYPTPVVTAPGEHLADYVLEYADGTEHRVADPSPLRGQPGRGADAERVPEPAAPRPDALADARAVSRRPVGPVPDRRVLRAGRPARHAARLPARPDPSRRRLVDLRAAEPGAREAAPGAPPGADRRGGHRHRRRHPVRGRSTTRSATSGWSRCASPCPPTPTPASAAEGARDRPRRDRPALRGPARRRRRLARRRRQGARRGPGRAGHLADPGPRRAPGTPRSACSAARSRSATCCEGRRPAARTARSGSSC